MVEMKSSVWLWKWHFFHHEIVKKSYSPKKPLQSKLKIKITFGLKWDTIGITGKGTHH